MLALDVAKQLGDFHLEVSFATTGRTAALFGPSGAGKTTIANLIAGLLAPDRGSIVLDDTVLFDAKTDVNVPPHQRHIGYVFQEGRLFPHLTVASNLDYGRFMKGHARDQAAERRIIDLLDIAHLLARRPGKLSGGERQRVAIGRALLTRPRLLLLDEARKREILPYLVRLRDDLGIPMIYVSHQPAEIVNVANEVVRIEDGRLL